MHSKNKMIKKEKQERKDKEFFSHLRKKNIENNFIYLLYKQKKKFSLKENEVRFFRIVRVFGWKLCVDLF